MDRHGLRPRDDGNGSHRLLIQSSIDIATACGLAMTEMGLIEAP